MREQRLVFGEVAELYDRVRAGYPDALVDDVITYAGADRPDLRALEVGAGTGKATVSFAARGVEVLAIEPSRAMAAVARRNCEPFPLVRIEETSFEDWPVQTGAFGCVYAAQAWHWVAPDVRDRKAAQALAPGGALAMFWHRARWDDGPLHDDLERLYQRLAPGLMEQRPTFPGLAPSPGDDLVPDAIRKTGLFRDETMREYPWSAAFTADSYTDLLMTQSGHRMLPQEHRAELLDGVRAIIESHGGEIVVPHATLLAMARRA
jgi:SAM-dependent methyltransferase